MTRTIYVSGNDGSGKSTFLKNYRAKLDAMGIKAVERHYYDSPLRTLIRGSIEHFLGITRKKRSKENNSSQDSSNKGNKPKKPFLRSFTKSVASTAFLWPYQTLMGLEARWRDVTRRNRVVLTDRCFIDDLVSITEVLKITPPAALVRWSCWIFPVRSIYYLSAGSEEEFARIVDVDLSPETHRRKHELYVQLMKIAESTDVQVHRKNTSSSR